MVGLRLRWYWGLRFRELLNRGVLVQEDKDGVSGSGSRRGHIPKLVDAGSLDDVEHHGQFTKCSIVEGAPVMQYPAQDIA